MTGDEYRKEILQALHKNTTVQGGRTTDESLARQLGVPWEILRQHITYLEQKQYLSVTRHQIGIRFLHFLEITPDGIEFINHEAGTTGADVIRILFLAANPFDTARLRLDVEMRSINSVLRRTQYRDVFEINQEWAVRVSELQAHFLQYKPHIVHFSGHGDKTSGGIKLEDDAGKSRVVNVKALANLFSLFKETIRCVLLNACYARNQAEAIAAHIDAVIGMPAAISDAAAVNFSAAFYQALGYGQNVRTAFDLACNQVALLQELSPEDAPTLLATRHDPQTIFLASSSLAMVTRTREETQLTDSEHVTAVPNTYPTTYRGEDEEDSSKLFATAHLAGYESKIPFLLGQTYILQAGVQRTVPQGFVGISFTVPQQASVLIFDIAVQAQDMEILPNWVQQQDLTLASQNILPMFSLRPLKLGVKRVSVDFFQQRHWLTNLAFPEIQIVDLVHWYQAIGGSDAYRLLAEDLRKSEIFSELLSLQLFSDLNAEAIADLTPQQTPQMFEAIDSAYRAAVEADPPTEATKRWLRILKDRISTVQTRRTASDTS